MRTVSWKSSRVLLWCLWFGLWPAGWSSAAPDYTGATLIVFNRNQPDSEKLARLYAGQRGVAPERVLGLDCPAREVITREEYESTIAEPLRRVFEEKGWWTPKGGGEQAGGDRVQVLALIYGMPLKVGHRFADDHPVDKETGKPERVAQGLVNSASVDSELALLGSRVRRLEGWQNNPYFRKDAAFAESGQSAGLLMVGRLDGPTPETVRRMIEDSVAVEKTGLWGRAYLDLARKGAGYEIGDNWIKETASLYREKGIPVVVDSNRARFPNYYPMVDAALYFGWYTTHRDGPLVNPAFRFKRGAVACHIHSFSAKTLRKANRHWVGPILSKGAAAALGNVYEPFLTGTAHLDIFNERLLAGYTLIESAYMATPFLSWMTVVAGDPLYRPFARLDSYTGQRYMDNPDAVYIAFHEAVKRWAEDPALLEKSLRTAARNLRSPLFLEGLALRERAGGRYEKAALLLESAEQASSEEADKLRMRLLLADMHREQGKKDDAVALLRKASEDFGGIVESRAVRALLNQLDPPPPPPPPPPRPRKKKNASESREKRAAG